MKKKKQIKSKNQQKSVVFKTGRNYFFQKLAIVLFANRSVFFVFFFLSLFLKFYFFKTFSLFIVENVIFKQPKRPSRQDLIFFFNFCGATDCIKKYCEGTPELKMFTFYSESLMMRDLLTSFRFEIYQPTSYAGAKGSNSSFEI